MLSLVLSITRVQALVSGVTAQLHGMETGIDFSRCCGSATT